MSIERLDSIEELRLATDFKYYCKWSGVDPIHWKDYILTPQHIKLIEWLMSGWDMVSVAYRWFGKSSLITNKYASWRATQHQKTISIFSATEDLACDKLRILKSSFETLDNLNRYCWRWLYTWTDKEIWLTDRSRSIRWSDSKEIYPVVSVIKAIWFDSKSRWTHSDIVIADDIVVEENTLNGDWSVDQDKIETTKRLFNQKVIPIRNPWGSIVLTGTPQAWSKDKPNESDLLFDWMFNKKHTKKFFLPAYNEYEEPNCPELHSKEFLELQRSSIDLMSWSKEYMLNPILENKTNINDDILNICLRDSLTYCFDYTPKPDELIILGTDFSIIDNKAEAEKKKSAYFALVPLAYSFTTQKRTPLNLFYTRWITFNDQINTVLKYIQLYWVKVVAIEMHWGMRYFQSELQRLLPSYVNIVDTSNHSSKFDTFKWLPSLEYLFTNRLIDLPNQSTEDKDKNKFLFHELKYMQTASHVDLLDALLRADTVVRDNYWTYGYDQNFNVRNRTDKYIPSDLDKDLLTVFWEPKKKDLDELVKAKQIDVENLKKKYWKDFLVNNEDIVIKIEQNR